MAYPRITAQSLPAPFLWNWICRTRSREVVKKVAQCAVDDLGRLELWPVPDALDRQETAQVCRDRIQVGPVDVAHPDNAVLSSEREIKRVARLRAGERSSHTCAASSRLPPHLASLPVPEAIADVAAMQAAKRRKGGCEVGLLTMATVRIWRCPFSGGLGSAT